MKETVSAIVLAAGKGTRMNSPLPKVLHPVAGVPMLKRVIDSLREIDTREIRVVVGHGEALVRKIAEPAGGICFSQTEQLGTAHAVKTAEPGSLEGLVLIVNGDHPLLEGKDLKAAISEFTEMKADLAVVTAEMKNPGKLGRIIRHQGEFKAIVEASDASHETIKIREVNSGIYIIKADMLARFLPDIGNKNAKKEYYLTDLVTIMREERKKVVAIKTRPAVAFGVNDQIELAKATRIAFKRKSRALMEAGVLMIDPRTTYIEESVEIGAGTVVSPGVYIRGKTKIAGVCVIESNAYLVNCSIAQGAHIRAMSHLEGAVVGPGASVGPFARIRPETEIGAEAHVGNFVEMKKVKFGAKSKAGHLTYLGDATIGTDTNIGCGTITCNYAVDRKKYHTTIGNDVFVGSDSQFVAPVTVGDGSIIASGSTITKDVPANALAVGRARQENKPDWAPRLKKQKEHEA